MDDHKFEPCFTRMVEALFLVFSALVKNTNNDPCSIWLNPLSSCSD